MKEKVRTETGLGINSGGPPAFVRIFNEPLDDTYGVKCLDFANWLLSYMETIPAGERDAAILQFSAGECLIATIVQHARKPTAEELAAAEKAEASRKAWMDAVDRAEYDRLKEKFGGRP